MAKKSQRRPMRYERDQLGCIWGFISMFNFRSDRSAQKLLVDRRHGSKHFTDAGDPRNKLDKSTYTCETSQETCDGEERDVGIDVGKPSVKKLIEQELFIDQETKKERNDSEIGQLSDSELEGRRKKNQRRKNRTRKRSCDNFSQINAVDRSESEAHLKPKHRSATSLDIDNIVEEFCCEIDQRNASSVKNYQHGQKHEDYKQKLSELIKFLISQKLLHGNCPREDSEILTSKHLMEVFQILGSDEELFLKLLQDPDILVSKDVQDLQNDQREKQEENPNAVEGENPTSAKTFNLSEQTDVLVSRKQRGFFRKKAKPQGRIPDEESESSDRIVILRPGSLLRPETEKSHGSSSDSRSAGNKGHNERISSHFFLVEIKRKLRNAISKEQRQVTGHREINEGHRKSVPTKDHFFTERMARPSTGERKIEKKGIERESGNSKQRLSNIYIEAKKHLSEMLSNGDIDPNFLGQQVPKSLGRILSLPEYLSPLASPGKEREQSSSSSVHNRSASEDFQNVDQKKKQTHSSPLGQITQESDSHPCTSDDGSDYSVEPLQRISSNPFKEHANKVDEASTRDESTSADNAETVKEIEIIVPEENRLLDFSSEQCSSSMTRTRSDQNDHEISETHNDERHDRVFKQDSLEETQPLPSSQESPSHSSIKSEECQVGGSDLPDRSSPISVLDPLFPEDDISPTRIRPPLVELHMQPLCIQFEETDSYNENQGNNGKTGGDETDSIFDYVKAVLNALNFNWEELYLKSLSSDQLLQPSLINNVPFFPNSLCSDHELLFDCINEVLLDFCGHQLGCSPWVSFIKRKIKPVSNIKNIVHKVQEGVSWHLQPLPLPRTLDQIVRKDMARVGNWMDLRFDVDCIGVETSEMVLDELLEEIISQLN